MIVVLIASLSLNNGFSGDQALFLIYAKAIDGGAVLYRDVWDIKQPAIFVFYLLGGKLFGFTETGIHLFEIIYWLGFGVLLVAGLKKYFANPLFAVLTPLFTIGIYYTVSGSLHLTQAEALVGFPLFLSLWCCLKFLENPDRKFFLVLSGFFGGIVLTFKLLFLPILLAFWFCLSAFFRFPFEKNAKRILISGGAIFSGLLIPLALVIIYFALNGALGDLYYTTFVYPSNAVVEITKMEDRTGHLTGGLVWFFKSYFPAIVLTAIFLLFNIKSFFSRQQNKVKLAARSENFLFAGLFIWLFAGLAVILIQRLSWWEYHYSLLMIPAGILAVKGIENIFEKIKTDPNVRRKTLAYAFFLLIIILLFFPTRRRLAHKIHQAGSAEIIKIGDRQAKVTGDALPDYRSISADTAFLAEENPKPAIFVVSNPLYYYLSGSPPVFASNGAMTDMFTGFEWQRLNREISEKPPGYIFIETYRLEPIAEENPFFINMIRENYSVRSTGDRGSFYKLNSLCCSN